MSYRMQRFSAPVFILLIWSLVLQAVGQNPAKFGKPYEAADQEQVVSYWTIDAGWHSELQLRNNMTSTDLVVTPVLRSASGEEATLPAITIQPNEVKGVDIRSAIETYAAGFSGTYGSVSLRFHSLSFHNLYAAMMVHDTGHPIAFHIDGIGHIDTFNGASREGIWWLPSETTKDILILTNQGSTPLDLELSLYDATGRESKQQLNLGPRQTGRYAIRDFVKASGLTGTYGGLRIKAASNAGALDTLHAVYDEGAGFSALLKMFDHDPNAKVQERDFARTAVWTLRAPMLALSNPDPALNFPSGTVLQPQLFVRNTTSRSLTAHLKFNWRKDNATGKSVGPTLALAPYETRRLDVAALQDGTVLPKDVYWTSVTLTTNSQPDEVLAVAASYDQSLRYGAQTPFSDQLSYKWEGGEWQYDTMHDSIITAGNGGTKPTKAAFTIFYEEGKQKYELEQELQPDEQMWIDVGKLIRERTPDKSGNLLPQNLQAGSYQFRDLGSSAVGSLFEGKVIYDQTFGHVSYGCAACCASRGIELIYDPFGVVIGFQAVNGMESLDDCQNAWVDVSDDFYNWTTANHAVATTTLQGLHTGMSVGGTTSSTYGYVVHTNGRSGCYEIQEFPNGPTNVNNLTPVQHNYPGNPLPNACWISQYFDRIGHNGTAHHAEDVTNYNGNGQHSSPAYGTPIFAMESGTITKLDGSEGPASPAFPACQGLRKPANTVWIQGNDGYTTRYVHLTPLPGLQVGQAVSQGQEIGTLDNSGCQQGAHLHVGRYPPSGAAVNFTIPCVNPTPTNQLWDGTVDDDDTAITP